MSIAIVRGRGRISAFGGMVPNDTLRKRSINDKDTEQY
jgi:hypothetical protein